MTNRRRNLILMSVPGREEDGSDTTWVAYDRDARKTLAASDRRSAMLATIARETDRNSD